VIVIAADGAAANGTVTFRPASSFNVQHCNIQPVPGNANAYELVCQAQYNAPARITSQSSVMISASYSGGAYSAASVGNFWINLSPQYSPPGSAPAGVVSLTCSPDQPNPGQKTNCQASITFTGSTAPTGTFYFSVSPSAAGTFSQLNCNTQTSPSGPHQSPNSYTYSCQVQYSLSSTSPTGLQTLTATYKGDKTYPQASGTFLLDVEAQNSPSWPYRNIIGSSGILTLPISSTMQETLILLALGLSLPVLIRSMEIVPRLFLSSRSN
jgi:hypothetical protein